MEIVEYSNKQKTSGLYQRLCITVTPSGSELILKHVVFSGVFAWFEIKGVRIGVF
jgi:hypothetical protein